jgi:hypothetical protein
VGKLLVTNQLEAWVIDEMGDVVLSAGEKVLDTDDLLAVIEKALTQMRAQEARTSGD